MSIQTKIKSGTQALLSASSLTSLSVVAGLFVAAPMASAQDTGVYTSDYEVVVTARKVEESLQDIPLSISAFSADDISSRSVQELEDIALLTPGLAFEDFSNGGFGTPIIRGATQFNITALEQNVSTFIDGVYIPRQYALDLGTVAMERIEVVKGPQSALYGANSFMGAINYITRRASVTDDYADAEITLGDNGRFDVSGSVSIPLIKDVLAVKLDAQHTQFDGDWENTNPGASSFDGNGTDDTLGGWDNQSFGISFVAQPADGVNMELGYTTYSKLTESRAQSRVEAASNDLNCGNPVSFSAYPGIFCGELPDTPIGSELVEVQGLFSLSDVLLNNGEETGFNVDPRSYSETETDILRASLSMDVTENVTVNYQFANIQGDVFAPGNADRNATVGSVPRGSTAFSNGFTVLPSGNFDYSSHEARLDYISDGGLYAMIGGFMSDGDDLDNGQAGYFAPLAGTDPIGFSDLDSPANIQTNTKTTAIFGRVEVPLMSDKLTFGAEGRYSWDEKLLSDDSDTTGDEFVYENDYFTPRVSLDYNISDDSLVYASWAKGVKSGGINKAVVNTTQFFPVFVPGSLQPLSEDDRFYGEDVNTTIEIGSKNSFMDGRLQVNAAAYVVEWEDLQVSVVADDPRANETTAVIIDNLGSASSKGVELDGSFEVADGLTLNGGLTFIDATYDDDVISQRIVRAGTCDGVVCSADGDIGGNQLPRSADTQWNIGAQYDGVMANDMDYFLRADYAGQSEMFVGELNLATIPSRALLNLRGGINHDNWSADIWVTNALDEEYVSNAFYIPNPFFTAYVPTWGNKRRIGVTLGYSY